jgi:hypothetical protein
MKTPGQIAQKLKQAKYRHVKKEMRNLLKVSCLNCRHNVQVKSRSGFLGVCSLDHKTCDPLVGDRSAQCEVYVPGHTKEEIKESLQTFFAQKKVHEIAVRFPDVAALLWVLIGDEENPQEGPLIPQGLPFTTLFGIPLWVDTPEELVSLEETCKDINLFYSTMKSLASILDVAEEDILAKVTNTLGELADQTSHLGELRKTLQEKEDLLTDIQGENAACQELLKSQVAPVKVPLWRRILRWN